MTATTSCAARTQSILRVNYFPRKQTVRLRINLGNKFIPIAIKAVRDELIPKASVQVARAPSIPTSPNATRDQSIAKVNAQSRKAELIPTAPNASGNQSILEVLVQATKAQSIPIAPNAVRD